MTGVGHVSTTSAAADTRPVADVIAAVATVHGDRLALADATRSLRYRELMSWVSTTAEAITGAAPAARRIGVLTAHDVESPAAALSVLWSGAAYVPLDVRLPDGRLSRILADADVDLILYGFDLAGRATRLARGGKTLALPDRTAGAEARGPVPMASADPAYVLYTSGTTGEPKGVVQSVGNCAAHAMTYADSAGLRPGDVVALLAGFGFDAAVMDIFGAFVSGAALVVIDPGRPARDLRRDLDQRGVSVLHCTPTVLRHLLGDAPRPCLELAAVRQVVLGGEQVLATDVAAITATMPGAGIINGLGPSECTVALQYVVRPEDALAEAVPIGSPVRGVDVVLLDEDGQPSATFGEIVLVSPLVALEYRNRPELTAAAFAELPGHGRAYRTGDLARRRPGDGILVFAGRRDRQVKIRGQRVVPEEIEAVLRAHPTVAQAAVVVDKTCERLLAYVTMATALPPDPEVLRRYAAKSLPNWSVPALVIGIDAIPVGPTGKRDLSRLPDPVEADQRLPDDVSPIERTVAEIWMRILGHSQVTLEADFMTLGGDSISMITMVADVEQETGAVLSVADVLAEPTVRGVAGRVREQIDDNGGG